MIGYFIGEPMDMDRAYQLHASGVKMQHLTKENYPVGWITTTTAAYEALQLCKKYYPWRVRVAEEQRRLQYNAQR